MRAIELAPLRRDRPTVPEVAPLVRALFAKRASGCVCWHVVLGDMNVEREMVALSARDVLEHGCPNGHEECVKLAKLLPLMSPTQVLKLAWLDPDDGGSGG